MQKIISPEGKVRCGSCHAQTFTIRLSPDGKELHAHCSSCSQGVVNALDEYGLVINEAEFELKKTFPLDKVLLMSCLIYAESIGPLNPDSNGNIVYSPESLEGRISK